MLPLPRHSATLISFSVFSMNLPSSTFPLSAATRASRASSSNAGSPRRPYVSTMTGSKILQNTAEYCKILHNTAVIAVRNASSSPGWLPQSSVDSSARLRYRSRSERPAMIETFELGAISNKWPSTMSMTLSVNNEGACAENACAFIAHADHSSLARFAAHCSCLRRLSVQSTSMQQLSRVAPFFGNAAARAGCWNHLTAAECIDSTFRMCVGA